MITRSIFQVSRPTTGKRRVSVFFAVFRLRWNPDDFEWTKRLLLSLDTIKTELLKLIETKKKGSRGDHLEYLLFLRQILHFCPLSASMFQRINLI